MEPALAATPYAAAGGVLLGAIGLGARRWIISGAVLLVASIMVAAVLPRELSNPQSTATGQRLRVLSANLSLGRANAAEVVRLVRAGAVDVLSLQELTPAEVGALDAAGLAAALPFRMFQPAAGAAGSGLASRFPLRELAPTELGAQPRTSFAQPAALVDLPGPIDVEFVAVHVHPPLGDAGTATWKRELAGLPRANLRGKARVLVGDFNATLDHAALRDVLTRGYVDAADQRGEGFSATWSSPPLTIDHVLADARMPVEHFEVFDLPGSDHDACYATLVVPN